MAVLCRHGDRASASTPAASQCTPVDMVHIATTPDTRAQRAAADMARGRPVRRGRNVVDRAGELRVALLDVFALPIFVSGVRVFELLPFEEHTPRVSIGRMVLQRESWSVPAAEIPAHAADVAAFARDRGMPRRVFMKSPAGAQAVYLDVDSRASAASRAVRRARPPSATPARGSASPRCCPLPTSAGSRTATAPLRLGIPARRRRQHPPATPGKRPPITRCAPGAGAMLLAKQVGAAPPLGSETRNRKVGIMC